ncbi:MULTISPECIES: hypothetical protein [unclassified Nitratiruptor]|uniref:hypothetical protein n=1 Tax=unclassified Nitratiruptor TaxID=2624044 RepID=UPI001915833B|nr:MULTISPECIES: hypothetical protein [unclassified Nitratiruptor]BCD60690.1 hypothetical protein NitYY0810_C1466 [Nitratiruptor sp. YY08-10]BCD64621.1 hypothetical protein NitYY0814_C1473 [Nitratiruptor sp. YY08-14]
MLSRDDVAALYIAMFQRAPSKSELDSWYNDAIEHRRDLGSTAEAMLQAAQLAVNGFGLQKMYPQYINVDPTNPESVRNIISTVYETLFNKSYQDDPNGIDTWVNQVISGQQSIGEAIASIKIIGEGIATKPDDYRAFFKTDIDFNNAFHAAKAFEAKVDAAMEVANTIENVKVDENTLKKMQDLIKSVASEADVSIVKNMAQYMKNEVEDHSDNNQQQNNGSSQSYDWWAEDKAELEKMPVPMRQEYLNFLKQAVQDHLALYNTHSNYDAQMLQQLANLETSFDLQEKQLYQKYHIPYDYDNETFLPNYDILNNPQLAQEYFNIEKSYLQKSAQALNSVNVYDVESFHPVFALIQEMDEKEDALGIDILTSANASNDYDFHGSSSDMVHFEESLSGVIVVSQDTEENVYLHQDQTDTDETVDQVDSLNINDDMLHS